MSKMKLMMNLKEAINAGFEEEIRIISDNINLNHII